MGKRGIAVALVVVVIGLAGCSVAPPSRPSPTPTSDAVEDDESAQAAPPFSVPEPQAEDPGSAAPADPAPVAPAPVVPAPPANAPSCPTGAVTLAITDLSAVAPKNDPSGANLVATIELVNASTAKVWDRTVIQAIVSGPTDSYGSFDIPDLSPGQKASAQAIVGYVGRDTLTSPGPWRVDVNSAVWMFMDVDRACASFTKSADASATFAAPTVKG